MSDLKSKKWDTVPTRVEFMPDIMKSRYDVPVFLSTNGTSQFGKNVVRLCIKCNGVFPLEDCSNCGSDGYVPGIANDKTTGLFCHKCDKGFTRWTCPSCNTDNPVSSTLAVEKSGCFIATAVYGDYDAPEVMVLRQFRDEILLTNPIGKIFTHLYYAVSPQIADFIASHEFLKRMVRQILIAPSVGWATMKLKSMKKES